jgi:hypothetical protein
MDRVEALQMLLKFCETGDQELFNSPEFKEAIEAVEELVAELDAEDE